MTTKKRKRSNTNMTAKLKIGIANFDQMKARTIAIAKGERRRQPDEPKLWFSSIERVAAVLSQKNRDLLRLITEKSPGSLGELMYLSGRAKSNLSRTLKTMENCGLVRLERGERGRITPRVMHDWRHIQIQLWFEGPLPSPEKEKQPARHQAPAHA
jgi:predicted transcriptional regulator